MAGQGVRFGGAAAPDAPASRRREERVPARLSVKYRLDGFGEFVERYSANISYNGVFIVTREVHDLGREVAFELCTADGGVALKGFGIVRWNRPDTGNAAHPPGIGLEFSRLDDENRACVRVLVDHFVAAKIAGIESVSPNASDVMGGSSVVERTSLPWSHDAQGSTAAASPAPVVTEAPAGRSLFWPLLVAGLVVLTILLAWGWRGGSTP